MSRSSTHSLSLSLTHSLFLYLFPHSLLYLLQPGALLLLLLLQESEPQHLDDREIALCAVSRPAKDLNSGCPLGIVSERLRADRGVVVAAVAADGASVYYACDALRAEKGIVLAAVCDYEHSGFDYADGFYGDRDVVLAAFARTGVARFEAVSDELRADREVALAAARNAQGPVLQHVAAPLRADREVARRSIARHAADFQFASEELRADATLAIAAVGAVPRMRHFVAGGLAGGGLARLVEGRLAAREAFLGIFVCGMMRLGEALAVSGAAQRQRRGTRGGAACALVRLGDLGGEAHAATCKLIAEFAGITHGVALKQLRVAAGVLRRSKDLADKTDGEEGCDSGDTEAVDSEDD